ncbi:hypothetical protein [Puniceicoccus vermicola]|uniref:Uncharacterized protein n=1 Tax=Puniceicoccus vermicola TaxID=388746 RepID=A0A7X1B496_9BACT|nr:hypothetical protein [Puniceicoccus vermicola]MBC2604228.1 hypothetical protein [Puniceicoccus vermicola]
MNIVSILSKVPWGLVIDKSPDVLEKGKAILRKLKNNDSKEEAVTDMAQLLNEQGQLIEILSEQNHQLFEAVTSLARRQRILWAISILSLATAAGSLLYLATAH